MVSIYTRFYEIQREAARAKRAEPIKFRLTDYELTKVKGRWRAREKASKKFAPKYVTGRLKKKAFGRKGVKRPKKARMVPGVRVTVGTGISAERSRYKFKFEWMRVVPLDQEEAAREEGKQWIKDKFMELTGRRTDIEDMYNFSGWEQPYVGEGMFSRKWWVNGVEHVE